MGTVKSTKARLDRLERIVPRKPIPLYITATWSDKKELWTAKIQGHPDLTAPIIKTLRRKIKRHHGENTYLVQIAKPKPLPEVDGDGIPIQLQDLVRGKEDDSKNKPKFEFL